MALCQSGTDLEGHVEEQSMDAYTFAIQQRTFDVSGYALNPSNIGGHKPIVGSLNQAHQNGYAMADGVKISKSALRENKRKRKGKGDASVVDGDDAYMGPWAAYEVEQQKQEEYLEAEEDAEEWRAEKKRREEAQELARENMKIAREEKTIFHGESMSLCTLLTARRQGAPRLCWPDVYAYSHRHRRQTQSVRWRSTAECVPSRSVYTYLGEHILLIRI